MKSTKSNIIRTSLIMTGLLLALGRAEAAESLRDVSTEELQSAVVQGKNPKADSAVSALDAANGWLLERELTAGWDPKRRRFLSIGVAQFVSRNPRVDKGYIVSRSGYAEIAKLRAKAEMVEFFGLTMDAVSSAAIPYSPIRTSLELEIEELESQLGEQAEVLFDLMEEENAAEAETLLDVEITDRFVSLLDAAIKKLDDSYNAKEVAEEKKQQLAAAKEATATVKVKHKSVVEKIKELRGSLEEETRSSVRTIARHPIFGVTSLVSFESWDKSTKQYQVAVILLWSPKMEGQVRAMMKGEDASVKPGPISLSQYLDDNWCTSVGPRRFRDDRGQVWFLGIASADAGKSSTSETKARESALQFSRFEAAMAVFSDIEAVRGADRVVQTVQGDSLGSASTDGVESLGVNLTAELRDREIAGLSTKLSTSCVHPISRRKLIITISGINQEAAMEALQLREGSYVTAVLDGMHQQIMKGTQAGQSSTVTKARTDSTPSAVAEEAAVERIQQGVESELSKAVPQVAQESDGTASGADCTSDCPDQGQAQSGTFSGAGQSDTDW